MWLRVFCADAAEVPPSRLAAELHARGLPAEPHFRGDDLGWTAGELRLPGGGTPVVLERYLPREEGMRAELNGFAAVLETMDFSPAAPDLMRRVIQTEQLITLRRPVDHADEARLEAVLECACRLFAAERGGVYQVDGQGWFAADGTMVLQEY